MQAIHKLCREHSDPLYFGSFFLPKARRIAVQQFGAFCRIIDQALKPTAESCEDPSPCSTCTVADTVGCTGEGSPALQLFRIRLDEIYAGKMEIPKPEFRDESQHALAGAMELIAKFQLPKQFFLDYAQACASRQGIKRFANWPNAECFFKRKRTPELLLLSGVLGMTRSDAPESLEKLAVAMELTDVLRRIGTNLKQERIYVPVDDMARFGYSDREMLERKNNEAFRELIDFQIARAKQLFRHGAEAISWIGPSASRMAMSAMVVTQAATLKQIQRTPAVVFTREIQLTTAQKFARIGPAWRLARRKSTDAIPAIFT